MGKIRKGGFWLSGILITLLLLAIGLLFDSILGQFSWFKPTWPNNLFLYGVVLIIGIGTGLLAERPFIRQLASFSTMLPSMIVLFIAGVVLMIYPLGNGVPYFGYVNGLPLFFLLVYITFATGLFFTTQMREFKGIKKVIAVSPLLGFLVFVLGTFNGQNDYYRMEMKIGQGRTIFEGRNYDGRVLRTPFALKLLDLNLPSEEVEVALRGPEQNNQMNVIGKIGLDNEIKSIGNITLNVDQYLPSAVLADNGFIKSDTATSIHAAQVSLIDDRGTLLKEGWICTGSTDQMPLSLEVGTDSKLSLLFNKEQACMANVRLFESTSTYNDHTLSRSDHITFKGWDISVKGFDPRFGSSSPLVTMDLIFDRWYEAKYIGLLILAIGLLALLKLK